MRVLLDTNIVSELWRPRPHPSVVSRLTQLASDDTFLSVITIGELHDGARRLPAGRRRAAIEARLTDLEGNFGSRILPLDTETARIWGELAAICEAKGRPHTPQDRLIAATAIRHGLHLFTRNVQDFDGTGVLAVKPWDT